MHACCIYTEPGQPFFSQFEYIVPPADIHMYIRPILSVFRLRPLSPSRALPSRRSCRTRNTRNVYLIDVNLPDPRTFFNRKFSFFFRLYYRRKLHSYQHTTTCVGTFQVPFSSQSVSLVLPRRFPRTRIAVSTWITRRRGEGGFCVVA